jgi:type II secretory pathway pseudopilin PulG
MYLEGQGDQRGYAMAAVLVALAVMSVVMTALLPVWRQQAQREKEAELVFRGAQYARAIDRYRRKNGNNYPPNIDILVQQKYLRKKYKDPMTGEDFQPLYVGQQQNQPGIPGTGRQGGAQPPQQQMGGGGLTGVQSKSKETSIRNHRGQTTYNLWQYVVTDDLSGPGFTAPGRGNQPGAGQPGQQGPGGPGRGQPGRGNPPGTGAPGPRGGGPGGGRGPGRGSMD